MRKIFIYAAMLLAACASTYHLPESERSRILGRSNEEVWSAAIAAVNDVGMAVTEQEFEHGRIRARAGGSIWDLKGHTLLIVIAPAGDDLIRLDANVENISEDPLDFGESERLLTAFLEAFDRLVR